MPRIYVGAIIFFLKKSNNNKMVYMYGWAKNVIDVSVRRVCVAFFSKWAVMMWIPKKDSDG